MKVKNPNKGQFDLTAHKEVMGALDALFPDIDPEEICQLYMDWQNNRFDSAKAVILLVGLGDEMTRELIIKRFALSGQDLDLAIEEIQKQYILLE